MADPIDIDAAERLCSEATPGPWRAANGKGAACVVTEDKEHDCAIYLNVRTCEVDECVERWQADARFIAAARTLLPQALSELASLRAENERLMECVGVLAADARRADDACHDLRGEVAISHSRLKIVRVQLDAVTRERDEARSELTDARVRMFEAERQRDALVSQREFNASQYGNLLARVERDTAEAIAAWLDFATDPSEWRDNREGCRRMTNKIRSGEWRKDRT